MCQGMMNTVLTLCAERCLETTGQMASNRTRIAPSAPREPLLAGIEIGGSPKLEQIRSPPALLALRLAWCVIFLGPPRRRAGLAIDRIDLGYYQGASPPPSGPFRGNGPGPGGVNRAYPKAPAGGARGAGDWLGVPPGGAPAPLGAFSGKGAWAGGGTSRAYFVSH